MVSAQTVSIINAVARRYEISPRALTTPGKGTKRLQRARAIAMYLAREVAKDSFPLIALTFGGMHHTSVMHACTRVRADAELLAEANEYIGGEPLTTDLENQRATLLKAIDVSRTMLRKALIELDVAADLVRRGTV